MRTPPNIVLRGAMKKLLCSCRYGFDSRVKYGYGRTEKNGLYLIKQLIA
jgi:hypothetical protein